MISSIARVGDRLLSALLPKDEASAYCPPDCEYQEVCLGADRYTQKCCYTATCQYQCSGLVYAGPC